MEMMQDDVKVGAEVVQVWCRDDVVEVVWKGDVRVGTRVM
jgi:hypothetical protein